MLINLNEQFLNHKEYLIDLVKNFDSLGESFGPKDRNEIKLFVLQDIKICVKSFKRPNFFNKLIYSFFRKSKAHRSFEHANQLIAKGIKTPNPIAFIEFKNFGLINNSFYICEKFDYDLTFRDLSTNLNFPNHEEIVRQFTRFTNSLHEKNILFLDHSPGNTLIKKNGSTYEFYLVDLNRIKFKNLTLSERISNFNRLTTHSSIVKIMSNEFAIINRFSSDFIFSKMWLSTKKFQRNFKMRRNFKKIVRPWKN